MKRTLRILLIATFIHSSFDSLAQGVNEKSSLNSSNKFDRQIEFVDPNMEEFVHFELELKDKAKEVEIYKAVHHFARIENYRFVGRRRKVLLSEDLGFVVLYSAEELQQQTGRSIRPQNILDEAMAAEVIFILTEQGVIKEQLISKK